MQDMEHVMYDQKKTTYSVTRHVITDKSLNLPSSLQSVQQFEYLASFNAKTTKTNFGFLHSAEKR